MASGDRLAGVCQQILFLDYVAKRSPILPPRKFSALLSLGKIWEHFLGPLFEKGAPNWISSSSSPNKWKRGCLSQDWSNRFCKFYESMWKLLLLVAEALSYHATLLSPSSVSGVLGTRCQNRIDGKFPQNSWLLSLGNTTSITIKKTSWKLYLMF